MSKFEQIKLHASGSAGEARALPFSAYTDEDVYEQEREKIFHGDWIFVCNEYDLPNPGDMLALTIAGESVVIIRGQDNHIRAMSNACSHRGTPLADEGFGHASRLLCPYHAWNYDLEGKLKGAPIAGKVKIDKAAHCLPQFAVESWHQLIFVNIDGKAEPLHKRLAGVEKYLPPYGMEHYNSGYRTNAEHWNSNWKLAIENAMESYHLFVVHKETLETVTPTRKAYYLEGNSEWTLTAGDSAKEEKEGLMSKMMEGIYGKRHPAAKDRYILLSLPPSFVAIIDESQFGYLSVLPDGPDGVTVRSGGIGYNVKEASGTEKKFVEAFYAEDKVICERAFKGMSSRFSHQGGQLVDLERIVVDFHQFYGNRMFGTETDPVYRDPKGDWLLSF